MIRQSPSAVLRSKSPELADAVEAIEARGLIAGQEVAVRGYSAADKDLHIIQLSIGNGKRGFDFNMQFNPDGGLIVTHSSREGVRDAKPAVVMELGLDPKARKAAQSIAESNAKLAGDMIDMAMMPARLTLGMMGAATKDEPVAAADNVVQLSAYKRPARRQQGFDRTNERTLAGPVDFAKPADALTSLQKWAGEFLPTAMKKRQPEAAPAPAKRPGA